VIVVAALGGVMARSPAPAPTEMVQKPTDEELVRAAERALSNQRETNF